MLTKSERFQRDYQTAAKIELALVRTLCERLPMLLEPYTLPTIHPNDLPVHLNDLRIAHSLTHCNKYKYTKNWCTHHDYDITIAASKFQASIEVKSTGKTQQQLLTDKTIFLSECRVVDRKIFKPRWYLYVPSDALKITEDGHSFVKLSKCLFLDTNVIDITEGRTTRQRIREDGTLHIWYVIPTPPEELLAFENFINALRVSINYTPIARKTPQLGASRYEHDDRCYLLEGSRAIDEITANALNSQNPNYDESGYKVSIQEAIEYQKQRLRNYELNEIAASCPRHEIDLMLETYAGMRCDIDTKRIWC
jgi:hypothetical protein